MKPLGREWRELHASRLLWLQKFVDKPAPDGFGVLYALVKKTDSEKAYIGKASAKDEGARYRLRKHIRGPTKPGEKPTIIHNAIKKHGIDAFVFIIIKLVPKKTLNKDEKTAIVEFNTIAATQSGYNDSDGGDGGKLSERAEARRKATCAKPEWKAKKSTIQKKLWKDGLYANRKNKWDGDKLAILEQRWKTCLVTRTAKQDEARKSALPYEPVKKKRIKGQCYQRPDGSIGKWDGFSLRIVGASRHTPASTIAKQARESVCRE